LKVWQVDVDGKGGKYCAGAFTPPRHACKTGMYDGQRVPLICQRKWGAEARFTVILEPYKGEPKITAVRLVSQDKGQRVIEIELGKNPKQHVMIGEGKYEVSSSQ
jgi:hypothetical protein